MELGLREAWLGSKRTALVCPNCGTPSPRASRRSYDGLWSRVFRVRPMRCEPCGFRFPAAISSGARGQELDLVHHLPFIPTEMEEQLVGQRARKAPKPPVRLGLPGNRCPACGSTNVRPGQSAIGPVPWLRFEVRDPFRCADCNGSFTRTNLARVLLRGALMVVVLGGLTYAAMNIQGWMKRPSAVPTIQKDQIPPPPPPVFR